MAIVAMSERLRKNLGDAADDLITLLKENDEGP